MARSHPTPFATDQAGMHEVCRTSDLEIGRGYERHGWFKWLALETIEARRASQVVNEYS
jgi:hypothetical protein